MGLSAGFIRSQLQLLKPLLDNLNLDAARKGQTRIGELMRFLHRQEVSVRRHDFPEFQSGWVLPRDKRRQGVILYLHGGGYTCGDLDYALGFASTLSAEFGSRVFCPAYRLAPEHPFPAAPQDVLTAYRYLLSKGYAPEQITLCGESAGGGLCFSLCLQLRRLGLPMPGGIIAISPWMDATCSGESFQANRERDPSLTENLLRFYAQCTGWDPADPLLSPLLGDLTGMPDTLIFVGGDEILLSDSQNLHQALTRGGCQSQLTVAPERWHGYVLYNLQENREDYTQINQFLNRHVPEKKLRWLRLDNAAKIYPASRSSNWSSTFRLSATLREDVDTQVLQSALDITVRRFPSISARLRRGVFWYYLEQLPRAPRLSQEDSYPLSLMDRSEARQCALRVIVYGRRIAVEFFHSLTDGTGGMIFLKTLLAEYLQQKHGVHIGAGEGVLGRLEEPSAQEMEDSFLKYAGPIRASRSESNAFRPSGTPEPDGFRNLVCLKVPVDKALAAARSYGVSLTAFLCAAMMEALVRLQRDTVSIRHFWKPVKVQLPVNLRTLFPSQSLRNFALYTNPEIDPRLGHYSFREICQLVHHHMGLEVTPKQMAAKIAANVSSEKMALVKLMPLFLKNIALKTAFNLVGEKKICLSLSNLGAVKLPEAMNAYVERMDFILAPQATAPHNCGVLSFGDTLYINLIRSTREPDLEARFYQVLREQGLPVTAESNGRQ